MADTKISALSALTGPPAAADELVIVDKSDTAMAASGTNKRLLVDELFNKFVTNTTLARYVPSINDGTLLSTETRDANGCVTSATIVWTRVLEGAANGVFTGTPHGTFITALESYTATYPSMEGGSVTMTVDFNLDSDGLSSNPTIVVA